MLPAVATGHGQAVTKVEADLTRGRGVESDVHTGIKLMAEAASLRCGGASIALNIIGMDQEEETKALPHLMDAAIS
jgi:hypothetical protein